MERITEQRRLSGPIVYGYLRLPTHNPARRSALTRSLADYCDRHELVLAAVFTDQGDDQVMTAAFAGLMDALMTHGIYGVVLASRAHLGGRRTARERSNRITATGRRLMLLRDVSRAVSPTSDRTECADPAQSGTSRMRHDLSSQTLENLMPRRNDRVRHHTEVEPPPHPNFDQPDEDDGTSPLPAPGGPDAARHLKNLRVALRHANVELYARLERPIGHPPRLRVHTEGVVENLCIHVGAAAGGSSHYAWAWGQLIGPATDPAGAATSVLRVLETRGRRI